MKSVQTKMPERLLKELNKLVEEGWYVSRSETIRDAVRKLIERRKTHRLEDAMEKDIKWGLQGR